MNALVKKLDFIYNQSFTFLYLASQTVQRKMCHFPFPLSQKKLRTQYGLSCWISIHLLLFFPLSPSYFCSLKIIYYSDREIFLNVNLVILFSYLKFKGTEDTICTPYHDVYNSIYSGPCLPLCLESLCLCLFRHLLLLTP